MVCSLHLLVGAPFLLSVLSSQSAAANLCQVSLFSAMVTVAVLEAALLWFVLDTTTTVALEASRPAGALHGTCEVVYLLIRRLRTFNQLLRVSLCRLRSLGELQSLRKC